MQHVFYSRNHFGGSTRSIQCRSWHPRPNLTKIGAAPDNVKKRRSKLGRNRIRGDACTAMCLSTDCTGKERQALELAAMCAARASASRRSEAQRRSTGTCKARVGRFVQHAFPDLDTSSISGPPRPPRWRTRFGSTDFRSNASYIKTSPPRRAHPTRDAPRGTCRKVAEKSPKSRLKRSPRSEFQAAPK